MGGTDENTVEAFLRAGAVGVGTGLSILKPELIASENYAEITRLTKLHIDIHTCLALMPSSWQEFRHG